MSKTILNHAYRLTFTLLLFAVGGGAALRADDCERQMTLACAYNPRPDPDDFALPMPGGVQMVFRKLVVPGSEFWGNKQRLVKIGDVRGDFSDEAIFEGVQRLPVTGAFYDWEQKHWYYYLGKYEVTLAQYLMLLGEGDHRKGLEVFYQASGDRELNADLRETLSKAQEAKFLRLLARPLSWVSWYAYQDFIKRYNDWCFATPECLQKLPRLPQRLKPDGAYAPDALPGFFRLPTELEWEYAARGGLAALQETQNERPVFEQSLPFPREQVKEYAWVKPFSGGKGSTRVGRWQPVAGLHDMFGNVQELVADLFSAETIQGKVGGLSARGGSYQDLDSRLRASMRSELGLYQLDRDGKVMELRSPTTGIRLAIGSLVVQSPRFRDDLQAEYQAYTDLKQGLRKDTPAGKSNSDDLIRVDKDLQTAHDVIDGLQTSNQELQSQVETIRRALNDAGKKVEDGTLDVCDKLARNAALILKTAGWHYARASVRKELIEKIKNMDISGRTQQIQNAQQTYDEHMQGFEKNFANYVQTVQKLGGYEARFVEPAFQAVRGENPDDVLLLESLEVLQTHVQRAMSGAVNVPEWQREVEAMALKKGVFLNN